jgi:hypothetical protein
VSFLVFVQVHRLVVNRDPKFTNFVEVSHAPVIQVYEFADRFLYYVHYSDCSSSESQSCVD